MKEYFNFSKKDRNAILLLLALIAVIALVKFFFLPTLSPKATSWQKVKFPVAKNQDTSTTRFRSYENENSENLYIKKEVRIVANQNFDPNNYNEQDWINIGLPEKCAKTIVHFVEKGGKFRKPEDLKRIYSMKPEWYEKLEPYIQIKPATTSFQNPKYETYPKKQLQVFNLNLADSNQLESLPMIGMKTANRIIKYREMIGGFYSVTQLKEVWGIRDSLILLNEKRLVVNPDEVRKLKINSATLDELKKHPYLRYKKANLIVNYRQQHGRYKELGDLKNIPAFTADELEKLSHYLSFE